MNKKSEHPSKARAFKNLNPVVYLIPQNNVSSRVLTIFLCYIIVYYRICDSILLKRHFDMATFLGNNISPINSFQ